MKKIMKRFVILLVLCFIGVTLSGKDPITLNKYSIDNSYAMQESYSTTNINLHISRKNSEDRQKYILTGIFLGCVTVINTWYFSDLQTRWDENVRGYDVVEYNSYNDNSLIPLLILDGMVISVSTIVYLN
jgi:hypothetical protein